MNGQRTLKEPLTMEECALLDKVLSSIPDAMDFAAKLKDCGLDVDKHIQVLKAQQRTAEGFKRKFFPECP